jgi:hypothetical protein
VQIPPLQCLDGKTGGFSAKYQDFSRIIMFMNTDTDGADAHTKRLLTKRLHDKTSPNKTSPLQNVSSTKRLLKKTSTVTKRLRNKTSPVTKNIVYQKVYVIILF